MIPQDQGGGGGEPFSMRISNFLYPPTIARCQHLKVNGVQCGSPALKNRKLCHFHQRWQQGRIQLNANQSRRSRYSLDLPILEDANSIQVALMQGMRLLLTNQVDHRTAALLFYALQTASSNLSRTTLAPRPQQVVIDPSSIADTSLGDDAWYKEEFTQDDQEAAPADIHATVNIQAMAESGSAHVGTGLRPVLTGQRPVTTPVSWPLAFYLAGSSSARLPHRSPPYNVRFLIPAEGPGFCYSGPMHRSHHVHSYRTRHPVPGPPPGQDPHRIRLDGEDRSPGECLLGSTDAALAAAFRYRTRRHASGADSGVWHPEEGLRAGESGSGEASS